MKTAMNFILACVILSSYAANAQSLSSVIDEAINFVKQQSSGNYHTVEFDYTIAEGTTLIRNKETGYFKLASTTNKLTGTKNYLKTDAPSQYIKLAKGLPTFTDSRNTFTAQTNSTSISNPELVDLLTISYRTSSGTVNVGLRNNSTITPVENAATNSGSDRIVKEYRVIGSVSGKSVTITLRLREILFG